MTAAAFDAHRPGHPVGAAVARVREELELGGGDAGVVADPRRRPGRRSVEVTRLVAQVAQLQLRLLAHAERIEVGAGVGARSAANWLAHQTRTTRRALRRVARLAKRLEEAYPDLDTGRSRAGG